MHPTRTKGRDLTSEQQREEFQREYEKHNGQVKGRDGVLALPVKPEVTQEATLPPEPPAKPLSTREVVLQLLWDIGPCTLAELTDVAFACEPNMFGAEGFERMIPCTHKVKDCLYSKYGLLKRGLVRSVDGGKKYEAVPCSQDQK